ncbi:MAG: hypothetical protein SGJ19_12995 [Planctomycetia bacterium]|nr:hypothetical protein [Planctomycetia bacterium]
MNHARCFLVGAVLALLVTNKAQGQDAWEHTPYNIQVYLALNGSTSDAAVQEIADHLSDRAETVVGGGWKLHVEVAPPVLKQALASGSGNLKPEHVPLPETEPDKVVVLAIDDGAIPAIEAREFDCRARQFGPIQRRAVAQPWRLRREAFLALTAAFTPLARVEPLEDKQVRLQLRAAEFEPRDPAWPWAAPGDLFRCVLRMSERSGAARTAEEIAWTLLEAESVDARGVMCHLETGVRGALSSRRGRFELFALGIRPSSESTRLEIRSRTPDARPLAGYDIYSTDRAGTQVERIGRTDRTGAVIVPAGERRYRILLIRDGQELLARLPMAPGQSPVLTARIPDDRQRLEVEAFVVGMQESVVDLVARRAVLLARAESRLDAKDLAEAEKLIEQLRRMETREQLQQRIATERRRFTSEDPSVQRKIDRLFDDTAKLLGRYLNPADVEMLQRRVRDARSAAASTK